MARYLIRRLLQMVLVLLGSSLVLFACLFVLPGNPVYTLSGTNRATIDETIEKDLTRRYHLNDSLPEQYGRYLGKLVRGDLGESYRLKRPVNDILGEKALNTLKLALAALLVQIAVGVSAGAVSALTRYSFWDVLVTLTTTLAIGLPAFVFGLVLQDIFGFRLEWLPLFGLEDGPSSYVLPAITLALVDAAFVARLLRGSLLEVLRADFVRTALAKGLRRRDAILRHALPNSLLPVVTYLGIAFGTLVGGAIVTESVFQIDGLGNALVMAITARDNPVVIAVVTYGVLAFLLVSLLIDLLYAWLDPRIRLGAGASGG